MGYLEEVEAYAAYLNGHRAARANLRFEELEEYEEDMAKAEQAMTVAWLEEMEA